MGDETTPGGVTATATAEPAAATEAMPTAVLDAGGQQPPAGGDGATGLVDAGARRGRHRVLPWVLGGIGVVVLGAIGFGAWWSSDHVAPGISYAGVDLGGKTTAEATDAVQTAFDDFSLPMELDGQQQPVTASDLGLQLDAASTVQAVMADQPAWRFWTWGSASQASAAVSGDDVREQRYFSSAWPDAFTMTEPSLAYDAKAGTFSVVPGVAGTGADAGAARTAFAEAFTAGDDSTVALPTTTVEPTITDDAATQAATGAQALVHRISFTIGDTTLATADAATVGGWVTVSQQDGTLSATYDPDRVRAYLTGTVAGRLDATPTTQVVLASDPTAIVTKGSTGKTLGDVSELVDQVVASAGGDTTSFALPVTEVPFETQTVDRRIDVALAARTASLIENGQVVATFPMSPGKETNSGGRQSASTSTKVGEYKVWYKTALQDMGCSARFDYCTPNVPWDTYFNGDQALHGTYWHNMFGKADMSHGCVNLSVANAKTVYDFAPIGTPVSVHY
jgi:lipoprotein-anchoring transpeptidase ErfK/SrfK